MAWARPGRLRATIAEPEVIRFEPAGLGSTLAERRPHGLWSRPREGYRLSRACSMMRGLGYPSPRSLLRIPRDDPPIACVLWACELGEAGPGDVVPAPQVHLALAARGVRATLAMQSRINDRVARNMASDFFSALASGMSFERSAALAPLGRTLPQRHPDWTSPAIWLAQSPTATLGWGQPPVGPAAYALAWMGDHKVLSKRHPGRPPSTLEARRYRRGSGLKPRR